MSFRIINSASVSSVSCWTGSQLLIPRVGLFFFSFICLFAVVRRGSPLPYEWNYLKKSKMLQLSVSFTNASVNLKSLSIPQQKCCLAKGDRKLTMMAVFAGLGSTLGCVDRWQILVLVHGDLASLFSLSSVPLSSVGSLLCGCSGCEQALPKSVTGMLATSGPGYIKPYWCASKMLPKLADDANAAKAVGGDRCYLSSPAPSSQIVPTNKAINLIDQHISFTATFMLQLRERFTV